MWIHCLGYFFPLPPAPSLSPTLLSLPSRTCSALFSNSVEEKMQAIIRKTNHFF
jgi:hypothetical protein